MSPSNANVDDWEILDKDWKADWPKHLTELVHAYNSNEISCHQVQPALPDVWVMTVPAC